MSTRQIIEEFLKRMGTGDFDSVMQLFADTVDWNIPGSPALPWLGRRSKRDEVANFFPSLFGNLNVVAQTTDKILVDGNDAVIIGHVTDRSVKTGKVFDMPIAAYMSVENGRIVRFHFYEDSYAVALACDVAVAVDPA